MSNTAKVNSLFAALANSRRHYDEMIQSADRVLENRRNEHRETIDASARKVAELESVVETFEALERDRDALLARTELDAAIKAHHVVVDAANRKLEEAIAFHVRSFASAGVALEAGFNAASARL